LNRELQHLKENPTRILYLAFLVGGIGFIFLVQHWDFLALGCHCHLGENTHFAFNKIFRLIANDICMLGIIHFWFYNVKITRLAFWIQLVDIFVLLPFYLFLKLCLEGDSEISSPLLSQLHRLIINPTLMILIFPAIYFQRLKLGSNG
jgi:exosortase F-associated protein